MADYRGWCGSCKAEINFGSHEPDCDYMHAQRIALKEQREWEEEFWASYDDKSDDELYAEFRDEVRRNIALRDALHASGKKYEALKDIAMNRGNASKIFDRLREEGLRPL